MNLSSPMKAPLRILVPSAFPFGRPCRSLGKPEFLVSIGVTRQRRDRNGVRSNKLELHPDAGSRLRVCERCLEAIMEQAAKVGLECEWEGI